MVWTSSLEALPNGIVKLITAHHVEWRNCHFRRKGVVNDPRLEEWELVDAGLLAETDVSVWAGMMQEITKQSKHQFPSSFKVPHVSIQAISWASALNWLQLECYLWIIRTCVISPQVISSSIQWNKGWLLSQLLSCNGLAQQKCRYFESIQFPKRHVNSPWAS